MSNGIKIQEVLIMKNTGFKNVYHSAENTDFLFPFFISTNTNQFSSPVVQ